MLKTTKRLTKVFLAIFGVLLAIFLVIEAMGNLILWAIHQPPYIEVPVLIGLVAAWFTLMFIKCDEWG